MRCPPVAHTPPRAALHRASRGELRMHHPQVTARGRAPNGAPCGPEGVVIGTGWSARVSLSAWSSRCAFCPTVVAGVAGQFMVVVDYGDGSIDVVCPTCVLDSVDFEQGTDTHKLRNACHTERGAR